MISPDMEHRVSQLRHDVDDVYELLAATNTTVKATNEKVDVLSQDVAAMKQDMATTKQDMATTKQDMATMKLAQRRHGNRLEEIQTALDLTVGRLDRLEQAHGRLEKNQNRTTDALREQADVLREQADALREQKGTLEAILAAVRVQPVDVVPSAAAITDGDDHR
jgi:chromosome segregation ATPase